MDNKKIIIIGVLLLIIVGAILVIIATSVNYEKIEITPNGTSIDVPANQTKYQGDVDGVKIWNWKNGVLVTHNNHEGSAIKLSELGFNTLNNLTKNGEMQNIDGFTCYVVNADELLQIRIFDVIKVNYNGKFYCIPLTNDTTQDNILICCNDKNIALHMAKSVKYKNVYPNNTNNLKSKVDEITGDLKSKANGYMNNTDLNGAKSTIEEKTGDLQSKANDYVNNVNLDDAKSKIEKIAGDLLFITPGIYFKTLK